MGAVFTGVGVALLTLFDDSGAVDAPATAAHASRLLDEGVGAVVVAGSTGEASALTPAERRELLDAVTAEVDGRVPVIAGTGASTVEEAVALSQDALGHGAAALLVLSPPGSDDLPGYYTAVSEAAGDTPVLAYHFPAVSAPGIPVDVLARLPVQGAKDSSGDPERLLAELDLFDPAGMALYAGSASLLALAGPAGCAGAILAMANVEPELCALAFSGDPGAQRALAPSIADAREAFPRGLKEMAARKWGTSAVARLGTT